MPKLRSSYGLAAFVLAAALSPAGATVLTFDIASNPHNIAIDQAYGDNVTAATMGGFSYGTAGGFTPNVVVDYTPTSFNSPSACAFDATDCVYWWDTGFSDLTNVIAQSSHGVNVGLTVLTFTADPGFFVSLSSLDLGYFFSGTPTQAINGVTVFDSLNNVVFSSGALAIDSILHTTLDISVTSSALRVVIDASNAGVGIAENIGVDNVQFSQLAEAPEPSTFVLVGAALAGIGALHRARKAEAFMILARGSSFVPRG